MSQTNGPKKIEMLLLFINSVFPTEDHMARSKYRLLSQQLPVPHHASAMVISRFNNSTLLLVSQLCGS